MSKPTVLAGLVVILALILVLYHFYENTEWSVVVDQTQQTLLSTGDSSAVSNDRIVAICAPNAELLYVPMQDKNKHNKTSFPSLYHHLKHTTICLLFVPMLLLSIHVLHIMYQEPLCTRKGSNDSRSGSQLVPMRARERKAPSSSVLASGIKKASAIYGNRNAGMHNEMQHQSLPPSSENLSFSIACTSGASCRPSGWYIMMAALDALGASSVIMASLYIRELYVCISIIYIENETHDKDALDSYSSLLEFPSIVSSHVSIITSFICHFWDTRALCESPTRLHPFLLFILSNCASYILKKLVKHLSKVLNVTLAMAIYGVLIAILSYLTLSKPSRKPAPSLPLAASFMCKMMDRINRHLMMTSVVILLVVVAIAMPIYALVCEKSLLSLLVESLIYISQQIRSEFTIRNRTRTALKWTRVLFTHIIQAHYNEENELVEPVYLPAVASVQDTMLCVIVNTMTIMAANFDTLYTDTNHTFQSESLDKDACNGFDSALAYELFTFIHKWCAFSGYQYVFGLALPIAIFTYVIWCSYTSFMQKSTSVLCIVAEYLHTILPIYRLEVHISPPSIAMIERDSSHYNFLISVWVGGITVLLQHLLAQTAVFYYGKDNPETFARRLLSEIVSVSRIFGSILAYSITEPLANLKYTGKLGFVRLRPTGLKPLSYRIQLSFTLLILRRALAIGFSRLFSCIHMPASIFIYMACLMTISIIYGSYIDKVQIFLDQLCSHSAWLMILGIIIGSFCSPTILATSPVSKVGHQAEPAKAMNAMLDFIWTLWKFLCYDVIALEHGILALLKDKVSQCPMTQKALYLGGASIDSVSIKTKSILQ